jgi:hypothetical protein
MSQQGSRSPGRKVLYWSERRVRAVAEGHGIHLQPRATTEWTTPAWGLLPVAKRRQPTRPLSRIEQARAVEDGLGESIEREFGSNDPCAFATGRTTVSFARLQGVASDNHAVIFAEVAPPLGPPIAICLFGSMTNFIEFLGAAAITSYERPEYEGWSSSAAPDVLAFIGSRCSKLPSFYTSNAHIGVEALKIANSQGVRGDANDPINRRPWRRAFTFGDIQETAEWLAEVYCDIDLSNEIAGPFDGYKRIIIGAPLWIMTPYLKSIRLYEEHIPAALDREEVSRTNGASGIWGLIRRGRSREKAEQSS